MSQYVKIYTNNYCINELRCFCKECKNEFIDYVPANYELVCFSLNDHEKRFLPTYGKYGYLDLLGKLVVGWSQNDRITKEISDRFEQELQKIVPYKVKMNKTQCCTLCGSNKIQIMQRSFRQDIEVNWLEIDVDYLSRKI